MAFRGTLDALGLNYPSFEGPIDIDYLTQLPDASSARRALEFIEDQGNQFTLAKYNSPRDVEHAWRQILRACIAHGVPLTDAQQLYAKSLGVGLPS
jgi:hypothetical protein